MIARILIQNLQVVLRSFPAVAILGARQTGKTTLAKYLVKQQRKTSLYLDLENPSDRDKLHDPYSFFSDHKKDLVIIDEVQRVPELFAVMRSVIDDYRKPGRFLLLGSASPALVRGVSESLAGRIHNAYLGGINAMECPDRYSMKRHWFRGGFPEMLVAKSDELFMQRMDSFINTFIERDLSSFFGISFSPVSLRRFWQMLAHSNGAIWNAHNYARALGISAPTVSRYIDLLEGAFMVHQLPAFFYNSRKRIIKAPKVYLRDTGVMHRLIRINTSAELNGNVAVGASWESYVVEQIYQLMGSDLDMFYYRTQDGAEADIVLTRAGIPISCIEIQLSTVPSVPKGFHTSIADLKTHHNYVVVPKGDSYRRAEAITVCGLREFLTDHLPGLKRLK